MSLILSKLTLLLIVSVAITKCAPRVKQWWELTVDEKKQRYYEDLRDPHGNTWMDFLGLSA